MVSDNIPYRRPHHLPPHILLHAQEISHPPLNSSPIPSGFSLYLKIQPPSIYALLPENKFVMEENKEKNSDKSFEIIQHAIEMLKTVYDPEIPVNVYDLGLIYKIDYTEADEILHVDMTLTAPGCPAADFIMEDVRQKLLSVDGPKAVDLRLVFEPEWNQDMMSEEAKLELGFL